jgi:hydroxyacylglutathione hydrolase
MRGSELSIEAIPAFYDNYIWLLTAGGSACAIVDPGDASPVLRELEKRGLDLRYILLTHHHADHIGGVAELLRHYPAKVFGPVDDRISFERHLCHQGDRIDLPDLNTGFGVLTVPAHTSTHIAYYNDNVLFPGDTLFSIGCGRLFEGTPSDMQTALDKLAALPAATRVYCAHEYTQSNCNFALAVEPDNAALKSRTEEVIELRREGKITLPSLLGEELAANPFMRTREQGVIEAARKIDPSTSPGVGVMGVIRAWKDSF